MKTTISLAVLACFLSSGGAFAQSVIDMPPHRAQQQDRPSDMRDRPERPERPDTVPPKRQWRMDRPDDASATGRGARFHIEDGQTNIDLQCPDGESIQDCTDALLTVIDRLQAKTADDRRDEGRYPPRTE
jgi:hypothetical protein